jgi:hypothetical protein
MLNVLELFCGLGGWSKAFAEAGHDCTGVDIKNLNYPYRFIQADLNDWVPDQHYDVILASPPCTEFSIVKKISNNQEYERQGLDLVYRTFHLIELIKPKWFVVENVKGLGEFLPPPDEIIRYGKGKCHKEAWLWSNIGKLGMLDRMIHYRCDQNSYSSGLRGLIPYPLSKAVLDKIRKIS